MKQTKKELARTLYTLHHTLPRKDLIQLFMTELNTTENSARTHISHAAKDLSASLGTTYRTRTHTSPNRKRELARPIVISNYGKIPRKELADKLVAEAGLTSTASANTHISQIALEEGLTKGRKRSVTP